MRSEVVLNGIMGVLGTLFFAVLLASTPTAAHLVAQASVVTVSGNVKLPGEYPYEDGLTVNAVLARAGGLDGEAVRQITVTRFDRKSRPDGLLSVTRQAATGETVLMDGDRLDVAAYKSDLIRPYAQQVIDWISSGEPDNVILAYEGAMRPSAFEAKVRTAWRVFQKQAGAFERTLAVRTELRGVNYVAVVTCQFSRSSGQVVVVFNHGGGILDVSLAPVTP